MLHIIVCGIKQSGQEELNVGPNIDEFFEIITLSLKWCVDPTNTKTVRAVSNDISNPSIASHPINHLLPNREPMPLIPLIPPIPIDIEPDFFCNFA